MTSKSVDIDISKDVDIALLDELQMPIGKNNKYLPVEMREKLAKKLQCLNMPEVAKFMTSLAIADARDLTEAMNSQTKNISDVTNGLANVNLTGSIEHTEESAKSVMKNSQAIGEPQEYVEEPKSWEPPEIYNQRGALSHHYAELLLNTGIRNWRVQAHLEKPIIIFSQFDEETAVRKLHATNKQLAVWFLRFCQITYVRKPMILQLDALVAGALFNLDDFRFSYNLLPPPFDRCTAGRGTVGVFVDMKHSELGTMCFGMTSAHVVFSELTGASDEYIEKFNNSVSFAHYDYPNPKASNIGDRLDFCLLEVCKHQDLQTIITSPNTMAISAGLFSRNFVDVKSKEMFTAGGCVVKYGQKTSLTVGRYVSDDAAVDGGRYVCVESESGEFAQPGDSGSAYMYLRKNPDQFVPIAIHNGSTPKDDSFYHVGCNIVECLRKYLCKKLKRDVDLHEVLESFTYTDNKIML